LLRYFITKNFFRLVTLLAFMAFIGVFLYAMEIDKKNVPPEGMRLPLEGTIGKPVVQQGNGTQPGPLEAQHMTTGELAMKLSDVVAESLSFTKANFVSNSSEAKKYFTETGYGQYQQFLKSASFEEALSSGNLQSAAYAEQEALEVTRGVYNGAYKWLFEVPVTISFIPSNADTYRDGQIKAENRRVLLRAQFTRVADPADPLAVKIEIWQILPPRRGS
jgi:hypothetical protein